jgi:hypothetical protein
VWIGAGLLRVLTSTAEAFVQRETVCVEATDSFFLMSSSLADLICKETLSYQVIKGVLYRCSGS